MNNHDSFIDIIHMHNKQCLNYTYNTTTTVLCDHTVKRQTIGEDLIGEIINFAKINGTHIILKQ